MRGEERGIVRKEERREGKGVRGCEKKRERGCEEKDVQKGEKVKEEERGWQRKTEGRRASVI
jgi:hypothetical protein